MCFIFLFLNLAEVAIKISILSKAFSKLTLSITSSSENCPPFKILSSDLIYVLSELIPLITGVVSLNGKNLKSGPLVSAKSSM